MVFNKEQRLKFKFLRSTLTCKQKFGHANTLRALALLDDVVLLHMNLGWLDYVNLKCQSYDSLMLEFLSPLNIDWPGFIRLKKCGFDL